MSVPLLRIIGGSPALVAVVSLLCVTAMPNKWLQADDDPVNAAGAEAAEKLPEDAKNERLVEKTYLVTPFLRCPHGRIEWREGWAMPIVHQDDTPDDRFLGPATPLGCLIQAMLVGHTWEHGVNHFAKQPSNLTITKSARAHEDVARAFSALAAMPAMNPNGVDLRLLPGIQRINVGIDRCVTICAAVPGGDTEVMESVLYDMSDLVLLASWPKLDTQIKAVDRQTWNDAVGGRGFLVYYEPARAVAVVQSAVVHEKIKNMLAGLRGIKRPVKKHAVPRPRRQPETKQAISAAG